MIAILATIGTRSGSFNPINEFGGTQYFTRMYERRTDLGNTSPATAPATTGADSSRSRTGQLPRLREEARSSAGGAAGARSVAGRRRADPRAVLQGSRAWRGRAARPVEARPHAGQRRPERLAALHRARPEAQAGLRRQRRRPRRRREQPGCRSAQGAPHRVGTAQGTPLQFAAGSNFGPATNGPSRPSSARTASSRPARSEEDMEGARGGRRRAWPHVGASGGCPALEDGRQLAGVDVPARDDADDPAAARPPARAAATRGAPAPSAIDAGPLGEQADRARRSRRATRRRRRRAAAPRAATSRGSTPGRPMPSTKDGGSRT